MIKLPMSGYVVFYYNKKAICGTWIRGESKDNILSNAIFNIECHYPNVKYNNLKIIKIMN